MNTPTNHPTPTELLAMRAQADTIMPDLISYGGYDMCDICPKQANHFYAWHTGFTLVAELYLCNKCNDSTVKKGN